MADNYGCFFCTAESASDATGHDEHLCYSALKLLEEEGLVYSARDTVGTGKMSFYVSKQKEIEAAILNNAVPTDESVRGAEAYIKECNIEVLNNASLDGDVVLDRIKKLIIDSPSEFCAEGIDLFEKLVTVEKIPVFPARPAMLDLEKKGFIIPRAEGSVDFWYHEDATEEVKSNHSNIMSFWGRMWSRPGMLG